MMLDDLKEQLLAQIHPIISEVISLRSRSRYPYELSDVATPFDLQRIITSSRAAIERSGSFSVYTKQMEEILVRKGERDGGKAVLLAGVLDALRLDLEAGYLKTVRELIHGELFGDFIEMAEHLLEEGYKDAAAVIAGSSLEAHLRQLCNKAGIDTQVQKATGTKLKKAEQMNSELAAASVYSKLDQKNVTAWLDLRNNAAHGHYDQYTKEQVMNMSSGIRDFITRNPA